MKRQKPLKVVVVNQPTVQEAKEKVEKISKELSAVYSERIINYDEEIKKIK